MQIVRKMNAGRRESFTLIELLIVVAIIAILAGMLLPALNKAREKSRAISCCGNLKEIGRCIEYYLDDNKDRYPYFYGVASGGPAWSRLLQGKIRNTKVSDVPLPFWYCPSDTDPRLKNITSIDNSYIRNGSYGYNSNFYPGRFKFDRGRVVSPSQKIVFLDAEFGKADRTYVSRTHQGVTHSFGTNCCFVDGHVARVESKLLNETDIWKPME